MIRSLLFIALVSSGAGAQVRNLTIDLHPLGGAVSMAWRAAPGTYGGIGLGIGNNTLGKTFHPSDRRTFHDFEQLAYVDGFIRRKPTRRLDVDFGLRGGLGDVRICNASDCLPAAFAGVFAAAFVGSATWKVGTRLIATRVWEPHVKDDVLHWDVISLRFSR